MGREELKIDYECLRTEFFYLKDLSKKAILKSQLERTLSVELKFLAHNLISEHRHLVDFSKTLSSHGTKSEK